MTPKAQGLEHIRIEFRCAEGALRRILGVVETRGFALRSMQMGSNGDHAVMTLALAPIDPFRRAETMLRQVARLQEVESTIHLTNGPPVAEVTNVAIA
ncbi:MAG: hypothetical protein GW855_13030 [Erythrobacter sp.]|nr:hypothetical protein [Erythrobacter sp.]NCQ63120.1 hypothetical protein [Alphaproteobacteria bacterium]